MIHVLKRTTILVIIGCSLILSNCKNQKSENNTVDYITETSGKVDFGKTAVSAYTPQIRVNMKKLYEDKFGMFVHWGPMHNLKASGVEKKLQLSGL